MLNHLHLIDVVIIVTYLVFCLVIGLYKSFGIRNIRDYTIGGAYVPTGVLMATLFATNVGAGSTVGTIEKVYDMGLIFAIALLFTPLFWLITRKIFAGNIERFKRAGCISISDVMGELYGPFGKWFTNIIFLFFSIGMTAMQITAIGYLLNYFVGIEKIYGVIIGFGVLALYSAFGGIRAVTITDVFQSLVLFVGIPAACLAGYYDVGGYKGIIANLPETHTSIDWTEANVLLFSSLVFYCLIPVSSGSFIQRFLMADSNKQLSNALKANMFATIPLTIVICLIGFIVKAKVPDLNPNIAFFYLIDNYLPPIVSGLVVSGILAAIMSTADSMLNTTSVLCAHDIVKSLFPKISDKTELLIARFSVLALSGFATFLAFANNTSILGLSWLAQNLWEPLVFIPISIGFLKLRTNYKSLIGGTIFALAATGIGRYYTGEFGTISMIMGMTASVAGLLLTHYAQRLPKAAVCIIDKDVRKSLFTYKSFVSTIRAHVLKHGKYYHQFGIFGLTYYFISSLFFTFNEGTAHQVLLGLRLGALFICFILCAHDLYISRKAIDRYMPLFWNFALMYCIPFLNAYTIYVSGMGVEWIMHLVLSEFLLYVLVGAYSSIVLSLIGFISAYLLFAATGYELVLQVNHNASLLLFGYAICSVGVLYFLRQQDYQNEEQIESKIVYSSAIAHEVRSPMAGVHMMSDIVSQAFLDKKSKKELSVDDFEAISIIAPSFKETSAKALSTIDRILNRVKVDVTSSGDAGIYSIDDCVRQVLATYRAKDLEKVRIDSTDAFQFEGSKHFVQHVISNIVHNALKYAGPDAIIDIWYENKELHIMDNGVGIESSRLPYIFNAFDKKGSTRGTGIGLAFCKRVMESLGGSIECLSEVGEFTHFIIKFRK